MIETALGYNSDCPNCDGLLTEHTDDRHQHFQCEDCRDEWVVPRLRTHSTDSCPECHSDGTSTGSLILTDERIGEYWTSIWMCEKCGVHWHVPELVVGDWG